MSETASIIICSAATSGMLADAVASLLESNQGTTESWELLLVDNSADGRLAPVTRAFQEDQPERAIRWIHEPRPSLSLARNAGMAAARGRYLCFLDDDVLVPEGWLDNLVAAFRAYPEVGSVAGRIRLRFEEPRLPRWLDPRLYKYFSEFAPQASSGILPPGAGFFGANFAIVRDVAERVGGFDATLGRVGSLLLGGEDTDYANRLLRTGASIAYAHEAWVWHRVPRERVRMAWMLRRHYGQGMTEAAMQPAARRGDRTRLAIKLLRNGLVLPGVLLATPVAPRWAFRRILGFAKTLGQWRWRGQAALLSGSGRGVSARVNARECGSYSSGNSPAATWRRRGRSRRRI